VKAIMNWGKAFPTPVNVPTVIRVLTSNRL